MLSEPSSRKNGVCVCGGGGGGGYHEFVNNLEPISDISRFDSFARALGGDDELTISEVSLMNG